MRYLLWLTLLISASAKTVGTELSKMDRSSPVVKVCFSPTGDRLITGHLNGHLRFYDTKTGKLLAAYQAHPKQVRALSISRDGVIASASDNTARPTIYLWNSLNGKQIRVITGLAGRISSLDWSSNGEILYCCAAMAKEQICSAIQPDTGKVLQRVSLKLPARGRPGLGMIQALGNHQIAVLWFRGRRLELIDFARRSTALLQFSRQAPWTSMQRSGRHLLLAQSSRVMLFDPKQKQIVKQARLSGRMMGFSTIAGKLKVFVPSNDRIEQRDFLSGKVHLSFPRKLPVRINSYKDDGKPNSGILAPEAPGTPLIQPIIASERAGLVAVAHGATVALWDLKKQKEAPLRILKAGPTQTHAQKELTSGGATLASITLKSKDCAHLSFSHDSSRLISIVGEDGSSLQIYDVAKAARLLKLSAPGEDNVFTCADLAGRFLITGDLHKRVRIFDSRTGKQLAMLKGHSSAVKTVAISTDGNIGASLGAEEENVQIWDLQQGKSLHSIALGFGANDIALSPDGSVLAVRKISKIELVSTKTFRVLNPPLIGPGHYMQFKMRFSPDSRYLTAMNYVDGRWISWDVKKRDRLSARLPLKVEHVGRITGVAILPNAVVSTSKTGEVCLWSPVKQKFLGRMSGIGKHKVLSNAALSPDGKTLAVHGTEYSSGRIFLWSIRPPKKKSGAGETSGSTGATRFPAPVKP